METFFLFILHRAKFYPEDVAGEIIQDITLRLFYLQVKFILSPIQMFAHSIQEKEVL